MLKVSCDKIIFVLFLSVIILYVCKCFYIVKFDRFVLNYIKMLNFWLLKFGSFYFWFIYVGSVYCCRRIISLI